MSLLVVVQYLWFVPSYSDIFCKGTSQTCVTFDILYNISCCVLVRKFTKCLPKVIFTMYITTVVSECIN